MSCGTLVGSQDLTLYCVPRTTILSRENRVKGNLRATRKNVLGQYCGVGTEELSGDDSGSAKQVLEAL